METMPMPLGGLMRGGSPAPHELDEFRIADRLEVAAMLRSLADSSAPLQLHVTGREAHVSSTLWAVDAERSRLTFAVDGGDPALPALLDAPVLTVVGYLDHVKVQFDSEDHVLTTGPQGSVVRATWPVQFHRFQRRNAYRVKPAARVVPTARLRHTDIAEMQLALRLLDVSIGGCALLLPEDVPPMQVGGVLNRVRLELDEQTAVTVDLRLQHVSASSGGDAGGVRLGCEFVRCDADTQRTLQRFIDQAQKRGRGLLTLD